VVEDGFTLADAAAALASWSGLDEDNRMDEPADVDSLPLEPGRRDVVRLMNLHKAKGLEAAIVFLADPLGGFDPRVDVRIVRQRDGAVGYFQIQEELMNGGRRVIAEPQDWERYSVEEKAYLDAEGDRLLYVAATRARDMLVVGRYGGRPGGRTWAWDALTKKMRGATELRIPAAASPAIAAPADLSTTAAASAMAASTAAHTRARRASWDATSVTAEAKHLPTVEVETTASFDSPDPTRAIVPATPSHRADAGLAWGTLMHGLLEHAMRHTSATRADLRRLAIWLTVEEPQLRRVIDQALDTVESVARAEFWNEAREASERHEEVPFAVRKTTGSVPMVVTGTIDLVHRRGDGWRVLDYKTDVELGDVVAQSQYARQLEDYSAAWERISGAAVTTVVVPARASAARDVSRR
jgi:ATP-dependent helicase/nuclease subunit A